MILNLLLLAILHLAKTQTQRPFRQYIFLSRNEAVVAVLVSARFILHIEPLRLVRCQAHEGVFLTAEHIRFILA